MYEDNVCAIGRIDERLHDFMDDTRSIIVLPVSKWLLKDCDVEDTTIFY
jgi:hypothetical protein